jgi:hypothetical protein
MQEKHNVNSGIASNKIKLYKQLKKKKKKKDIPHNFIIYFQARGYTDDGKQNDYLWATHRS